MRSLKRVFNKIRSENPYWSDYTCFAEVCLEEELMIIKPKLVIPLGRLATGYFLKRYFGVRKYNMKEYHGIYVEGKLFDLLPLYHPAFVVEEKISRELYEGALFKGLEKFKWREVRWQLRELL